MIAHNLCFLQSNQTFRVEVNLCWGRLLVRNCWETLQGRQESEIVPRKIGRNHCRLLRRETGSERGTKFAPKPNMTSQERDTGARPERAKCDETIWVSTSPFLIRIRPNQFCRLEPENFSLQILTWLKFEPFTTRYDQSTVLTAGTLLLFLGKMTKFLQICFTKSARAISAMKSGRFLRFYWP